MRTELEYYAIKVDYVDRASISLFFQVEKSELFISPHAKLCGLNSMACIESKALAEEYLARLLPVLNKRHGEVEAEVITAWGWFEEKGKNQVAEHSAIIRARLRENNFAPNRRPKIS